MATLQEKAYAKVNLTLDVLGKREDGYHDLKSVMQTVSLYDTITIHTGTEAEWKIRCNKEGIPCDSRNLVWKAAEIYLNAVKKDVNGLEIVIDKCIPSGAGMGGGSADAAAVLRILNRFCGEPLSVMELAALGAQVGSDVPFCVVGGTVMCEGRGEILTKLPDMPGCVFAICKPEFSVSTPVLYRKLDEVENPLHPDNAAMEAAIRSGDLAQIVKHIENAFDPVVSSEHPEIDHIKGIYRSHGALVAQMTGSGSVVFAIMPDRNTAEAACMELKKYYKEVFVAETV